MKRILLPLLISGLALTGCEHKGKRDTNAGNVVNAAEMDYFGEYWKERTLKLVFYGDSNKDGWVTNEEEEEFDKRFLKDNDLVEIRDWKNSMGKVYNSEGKEVDLGNMDDMRRMYELMKAYNPNQEL